MMTISVWSLRPIACEQLWLYHTLQVKLGGAFDVTGVDRSRGDNIYVFVARCQTVGFCRDALAERRRFAN